MVVTALGLLLGGRADAGAVRQGASQARVEGPASHDRSRSATVAARAEEAGAELDDDALILARTVTAEGRSRASAGGAAVPAGAAGRRSPRPGRRARAVRPAAAAPAGPAARVPRRVRRRRLLAELLDDATATTYDRLRDVRARARRASSHAPPRARPGGRRAALRLGEIDAVDPKPGEDAELARRGAAAGARRRPAPGGRRRPAGPERRRGRRSTDVDAMTPGRGGTQAPRRRARARPATRRAGRRARVRLVRARRRRRRHRGLRRRPRHRPGAAGRRPGAAGGAGRAHPQVRRHASTTCSPGREHGRDAAAGARRRRHRGSSAACTGEVATWRDELAEHAAVS